MALSKLHNPQIKLNCWRQHKYWGYGNMIVSAWWGGNRTNPTYGIRVGHNNRDNFFNPAWAHIKVEIDGELHTFRLTPGFWRHCPEFRDPDENGVRVIRNWLQHNFQIPWEPNHPPHFVLEIVGEGRFRLARGEA
jgi:hypothetical protein